MERSDVLYGFSTVNDGSMAAPPPISSAVRASKRVRRTPSNAAPAANVKKKIKEVDIYASNDHFSAESSVPSMGHSTVAVFLQKTYAMINDSDQNVCSWAPDGESFIIKDPERFEADIIPNYFGHSKLSSFARQLNFYGFHKVQSKPIRNNEVDPETTKYLVFANENFKRDYPELLSRIQRSTRGGNAGDHDKEVESLKQKVSLLEGLIQKMSEDFNRRIAALEMSGSRSSTVTTDMNHSPRRPHAFSSINDGMKQQAPTTNRDAYPRLPYPSTVNNSSTAQPNSNPQSKNKRSADASYSTTPFVSSSTGLSSVSTLPPHPKQKSSLPSDLDDPVLKEISLLRGVSTLGALRGLSIESLGLDDASIHFNESDSTHPTTPGSFNHSSPLVNNNPYLRESSCFSLSIDDPVTDSTTT